MSHKKDLPTDNEYLRRIPCGQKNKNIHMKKINKLFIPLLLLVAVAGCKKSFLDRPSQSQIASNNFYQTTKEIRLATASLYGGPSAIQWHHSGVLQFGDVMSGNGTTGQ